jgi:hypothetical protein
VTETFRVALTATQYRRVLPYTAAPAFAILLLLRTHFSGALADSPRRVVALAVIAALVVFVALRIAARSWLGWASRHHLEVTDTGMLIVDSGESAHTSFELVKRLDVIELGGWWIRARLTYVNGFKEDLKLYEDLPRLVALLKDRLPSGAIHERHWFSRKYGHA